MQFSDAHHSFDQIYKTHQRNLCCLACKLTGSWPRAEEIVQEAFMRLAKLENPTILSAPGAWLKKVVTNLCLDELKSAARRKTDYPGVNLPEPPVEMQGDESIISDDFSEESLSISHLLCLNKLSPVERAIFVLREAMNSDYHFISEIVQLSPPNCRQIFRRSRKKLRSLPRSAEVYNRKKPPGVDPAVLQRFLDALGAKDIKILCEFLREDIVYRCDGGGKATALPVPVFGVLRVARLLIGMTSQKSADITIEAVRSGGNAGLLARTNGIPTTLVIFDFMRGKLRSVHVQRNPDKLARIPLA